MPPPGPENGKAGTLAKAPGSSRKLNSNDARIVKQAGENFNTELFPPNVMLMQSRGRKHEYRVTSRDIVTECVCCGGRLIIDAERPFAFCFGRLPCIVNKMAFSALAVRL